MKYWALALAGLCTMAAGCAFYTYEDDESGHTPIQGTVDRQTEVVRVTLYQTRHDDFLSTQSATGFVQTEDGSVMNTVKLHFQNIRNAADENATEIPVGNPSDISHPQEFGVGITWYETEPSTEGTEGVVYEHGYNEGDAGEVSGVFIVDDTDWTSYLVGRLEAHIDNSGHGVREFDLAWSWGEIDG